MKAKWEIKSTCIFDLGKWDIDFEKKAKGNSRKSDFIKLEKRPLREEQFE